MKFSLLFICMLFAVECHPDPIDWVRVHDLTVRGIHQLYSLEVDSAMHSFGSVSRLAPGDPRGPFFQSMVHFYLYGLNRDERELATFLNESERVIDICEQLLDQNGNDATTKFYLGGIYGYRGLAYHTNRSYLKAAQEGRKGYLLLEDAVFEKPDLYDAHMGFGLFQYLLAKLPRSMQWILSVLGFSGDLEGGLRSLQLAADKGVYTRTEAKLFLAQFLFAEGRRDTAMQFLNELRNEFPENTLFMVLYAFWQHRLDNLDEAMKAAKAAIDLNNRKKVRYGEELAYSTLGSIYFTMNDFTQAAAYYRLYMRMTSNDQRTPSFTFYRAGVATEISGDRTTALEFYRRMKPPEGGDRGWNAYHYRRGRELLHTPLTEPEVLIIKGGNEFSQDKYPQAIRLHEEALKKANGNTDLQARALYGVMQAQYGAEMLVEARETGKRLVVLKPVNEGWTIPHGWFKLGQAQAKLGNTAEARVAFSKVGDFDDYDYQERLERQLKEELENLNRRSAP